MDIEYDIVIVGGGVSGLFSSIILSKYTNCRVGIFEQGYCYSKRHIHVTDYPQIHIEGVGGAGTIEGGKLCNKPASSSIWDKTFDDSQYWDSFIAHLPLDEHIKKQLTNYWCTFTNDNNTYIKNYSTSLLLKNEMSAFINNLIDIAKQNGVEIHTEHKLTSISKYNSKFKLSLSSHENKTITSSYVIISTGRSSAGKIDAILKKTPIPISLQPPDLGIRIEFHKEHTHIFSNVGKDTKIKTNINDNTLRTFCVCSGGMSTKLIIDNQQYYDGSFGKTITNKVNLGVMARNNNIIGLFSALQYCDALSNRAYKDLTLDDFLKYRSKLLKNDYYSKFSGTIESIAIFIERCFQNGYLTGLQSEFQVLLPSIDRYNSYIKTDSHFESDLENLFIIGDVTGISRGYIQSLWSGWCSSHQIISKVSQMKKYNNLIFKNKEWLYA